MTVAIIAIFTSLLIAGYIAVGFGEESSIPTYIPQADPPQGGLVESILAPFRWVYESIGTLFSMVNGIPSGVPDIVIIIGTTILGLIVLLYVVKLVRG